MTVTDTVSPYPTVVMVTMLVAMVTTLTNDGDGHHVPVAHGCHGDDGPPEAVWDAGEGRAVLEEEDDGGEKDRGQGGDDEQHPELLGGEVAIM